MKSLDLMQGIFIPVVSTLCGLLVGLLAVIVTILLQQSQRRTCLSIILRITTVVFGVVLLILVFFVAASAVLFILPVNSIPTPPAIVMNVTPTRGVTDYPVVTPSIVSPTEIANLHPNYVPITPYNVDRLVMGFAPLGGCGSFSPDGKLYIGSDGIYDVATWQRLFRTSNFGAKFNSTGTLLAIPRDGVYDVATWQRRFAIQGSWTPIFSQDSNLLVVPEDGIYNVTSGQRLFALPTGYDPGYFAGWASFSPNNTLVVIPNDAVYETSTGRSQFKVSGNKSSPSASFSPDGTLLAVAKDGVYDVATGQRRFTIGGEWPAPAFSSDGRQVAVSSDGVYDTATGQRRLAIKDFFAFSSDKSLLAISNDGVYDAHTLQRHFLIGDGAPTFSADNSLLVVGRDAVYVVVSGERRFRISGYEGNFSPDNTLLAVSGNDGVYDISTGQRRLNTNHDSFGIHFNPNATMLILEFSVFRPDQGSDPYCVIYGSSENQWPYRSGFVGTKGTISILDTPRGTEIMKVQDSQSNSGLPVYGRTGNNDWFKVYVRDFTLNKFVYGWVSANDVDVISIPDEVPVENE